MRIAFHPTNSSIDIDTYTDIHTYTVHTISAIYRREYRIYIEYIVCTVYVYELVGWNAIRTLISEDGCRWLMFIAVVETAPSCAYSQLNFGLRSDRPSRKSETRSYSTDYRLLGFQNQFLPRKCGQGCGKLRQTRRKRQSGRHLLHTTGASWDKLPSNSITTYPTASGL